MKVERIEFYCDMCGRGDDSNGSVSYLGWVFLEGYTKGAIDEAPKEIQFCWECYPKLVQYLWGPK